MAKINVINKLLSAQERLGINQGELAGRLGVAQSTISRVLSGLQPINPNLAARISKAGIGSVEDILHYQYRKDCESAKSYPVFVVEKDCLK